MYRTLLRLLVITLLIPAMSFADKKPIKIVKGDAVFPASVNSSAIMCLEQKTRVMAGKVMDKGKMFMTLQDVKADQLKNLKLSLKKAAEAKSKAKIKKKISKIKVQISSATAECRAESLRLKTPPTPLPAPCDIALPGISSDISENQVIQLALAPKGSCTHEVIYKISSEAKTGQSFLEGGLVFYHAGFGSYQEEFSVIACYAGTDACSAPAVMNFKVSSADFSGRKDILTKYRNKITEAEAKHVIKKLALNDRSILSDDLKLEDGYNLEALINKLLNPYLVHEDLQWQLKIFRDGGLAEKNTLGPASRPLVDPWNRRFFSASTPLNSVVEQYDAYDRFQDAYFRGYNPMNDDNSYSGSFASPTVLGKARYLSPAWQVMNNFWLGHFGTSMHTVGGNETGYYIRDYLGNISRNSLGNFKTMMLGIKPQDCLAKKPEDLPSDRLPSARGILCDGASQYGLSNYENTYFNKNQNFAREFLELYLLGPNDLVTGDPNYSENDVEAATAFLSGYKVLGYQSPINNGRNPDNNLTRWGLVYDESRHDHSELTAFKFFPYEIKGPLNPVEFATHVIDNHPGVPRFIAGKIFRSLIYRDPSEQMVAALAQHFKTSNFDIASLFFAIATSEAMFSKDAVEPGCVEAPIHSLVEVMRNFNMPYYLNYVPVGDGHLLNAVYSAHFALSDTLAALGEKPIMYDTVFSYKYCGRKPEQVGEDWLSGQLLLQRIKRLIAHTAVAGWANASYFNFSDVLNRVPEARTNIYKATPSAIINYYNQVFNVKLSPAEYDIVYNYLTENLDESGKPVKIGWNPADKALMGTKLAGLTTIYASMSQSNVK